MEQLGCYLKTQRELRNIDLNSIADETKISINWLNAIENDEWNTLPGKTFARGFVQAYVKSVGLDATDVLTMYDNQFKETEETPLPQKKSFPVKPVLIGLGAALLLVVILVLVL